MSKRSANDMEAMKPFEQHDSGFMAPMVMFPTFPHNDTFIDNRILTVHATPVDNQAEVYTFIHHKQEYEIMNIEDTFYPCLAYLDHLLREVPSGYLPAKDITLCVHDTPGQFDSIAHLQDGADGWLNLGARERYLACSRTTALECYDHIDLMGLNKRYVPSSYELKVVLQKQKFCLGHNVSENTGSLQWRTHPHPNLIAIPVLEFFGIKINKAFVQPLVHNSREAYLNLQRILNRRYDEMPFSHTDYRTSHGIIVTDLLPNKDSYNQVLSNSTSGVEEEVQDNDEYTNDQPEEEENYDDEFMYYENPVDNDIIEPNNAEEVEINEDDDDAYIDDETCRVFLQQLLEARQLSAAERKQNAFIPSTKKFLNLSFEERTKRLTITVTRNLLYLCENIVNI
ncbi:Hypothetical predicted protein [Paramuricea clavata]|uniref:Uncharacterized protein n=1 Tax=Paramuricea clavata TaxID=317549 RepID=A0A6S7HKH9_PARCT|nr:Hypothetical predicted protein [Paramuricea clavata]